MIIPFFIPHAGCPHQCVFCDQKRITGRQSAVDPSVVPRVIASYLSHRLTPPGSRGAESHEAAFYGGSFTALPLPVQRAYLAQVQPFIASGAIAGIRVSTRPDALSTEIMDLLEQHHVRSVELGAQSMDDEVLRCSGRGHCAEDTVRAVRQLRSRKIGVGLQIMPGLPKDSETVFLRTVRMTIDLRPDIVRLYPVLVLSGTALERLFRAGTYSPLPLDDAVDLCGRALLRFRAAGIPVIRIGLQSSEELEQPGTIIAGPYHPCFRQLVESSLFLQFLRTALTERTGRPQRVTFLVHPADMTAAIGQKRRNVLLLEREFGLAELKVRPDAAVQRGTVSVQPSW